MNTWEKIQLYAPANPLMNREFKKHKARLKRKKAKKATEKTIKGFQAELKDRATPAEKQFKKILNSIHIAYDFQRIIRSKKQHYIVDFYLPEYHVVIEIDGGYHDNPEQIKKDEQRAKNLQANKIVARVLRFTNDEVLKDIHTAKRALIIALCPPVLNILQANLGDSCPESNIARQPNHKKKAVRLVR